MRRSYSILIIFSLSLVSSNISSQLDWKNFSNPGVVSDMHFEEDLIWLATQGGLFKFDMSSGSRQIFRPDNSPIKGIGVDEIVADSDGSVWFGSHTSGLYNLKNQDWIQFRDIGLSSLLTDPSHISPYNNGIWFISRSISNGVIKRSLINYENGIFTDHSDKFQEEIVELVLTNENEIWLRSFNFLYKFDGQNNIEIIDSQTVPFIANRNITQMEKDQDGNLYLLTSVNLSPNLGFSVIKFNGTDWNIFFPTFQSTTMIVGEDQNVYLWLFNGLEEDRIVKLNELDYSFVDPSIIESLPVVLSPILKFVDEDGRFWFHAFNEEKMYGVLDDDIQTLDLRLDNLSSNYPNTFTESCQGNIIVGDNIGISTYINESWQSSPIPFQAPGIEIFSDPNTCDIWYSSFFSNSELYQFTENDFIVHDIGALGGIGIDASENGEIIFGSITNGLGVYDGNEWTWYNGSNSPLESIEGFGTILLDAISTSDGAIWVMQLDYSILRFLNDTWQQFNLNLEGPIEVLNKFYEDNEDNVWTWDENKLYEFSNENWTTYFIPFEGLRVSSILQDQSNNYWISTTTHGLLFWDKSEFTMYNVDNSDIGTNYIKHVYIDENEDVWCLNDIGISKSMNAPSSSVNQLPVENETELHISPNPADNTISILLDPNERYQYKIFTGSGQLAESGKLNETRNISIENLKDGLYILQVAFRGQTKSSRFIKISN